MMRLGAHNSIAGGFHNAVAECKGIGGEALQIFCKNQRQWRAKPIEPEAARAWKEAVAAAGVGPVMVHASYLVNLGNPDPDKREASRLAFLDELVRSEQLGIPYLNFHPGSHLAEVKGERDARGIRDACLERIAQAMAACIDETPGLKVRLVVENAAGQGTNVGSSWEEVGRILDLVGSPGRTGATVDTQHAWASGYDWLGHYDEVWEEFDGQVGLRRLVGFHLNDSKMPCGSRLDRHDAIGQGQLGVEFFRALVNDRRFDGKPGILETPDGPDGWREELRLLRSLRT